MSADAQGLLSSTFWISVLSGAVRSGTPVLLAGLGEVLAERSGILNLGVEGAMVMGAAVGFIATAQTGTVLVGLVAAALAGLAISAIHALLCVPLRANQVGSGIAVTIFGLGVSAFIGRPFNGRQVETLHPIALPVLSKIPVLGTVLFEHNGLVYFTYLLVPVIWFLLYKTHFGLSLRMVGESPEAADAMGLPVDRLRFVAVLLGGALAGVGGAYLSLVLAGNWVDGMSAGNGWIAVALVIFAAWDPLRAVLGSYLFGGVLAFTQRVQAVGIGISPFLLGMAPYVFTLLVLVISMRRAEKMTGVPAALGALYSRE
ncbi:ABC transporter permease [Leptolyngbya sp. FACHB-261]|uniref:ABC transporter permease n=1 Tax=Leptolyngbya sp. FACHB-261 TaxID=2692806 RepID=UPI001682D665|nr:ABC transporter permease [Leptolyngbya sp. FACHB-261]MBD2102998.1 ABC transporter permease [Leptolyngbya sp. FACHB-261]